MLNIVAIAGTPSHPSRAYGILEYSQKVLQIEGIYTHILSVRDFPAEDLVLGRYNSPSLENAVEIMKKADGVIICTPIYKAAYTGVLKAFLDLLPQDILQNKVVLPIGVGGTIAHLLTINYALKPVLCALGAQHTLSGVYALDKQIQWQTDGSVLLDEEIDERLKKSLHELVKIIQNSRQMAIL
ncbi:NADPH-dependent FMN reductase [Calothrix sp. NIES-4071]|nr:NADPH-dependent FMN reductase [Calothrix sp. NIES-4071]BAZ56909.1 NADPH-dependent FMN reductase [Calothrix sp. NIES-4105]